MKDYTHDEKSGVLDIGYARERKTNRALKYRLWRRTNEVRKAINKYLDYKPRNIIDLGTADGEMLYDLSTSFPDAKFLGVEYSRDLVEIANQKNLPSVKVIEGDVNEVHKLVETNYDVVIATAVIEHVDKPEVFMKRVYNLLNTNGILILTAPDPIWEHIATLVGHLEDEQHNEVPNLKRLKQLSETSNLKVELLQKFMISPIGIVFEDQIENILRSFGLSFMLANQLLVSRKIN